MTCLPTKDLGLHPPLIFPYTNEYLHEQQVWGESIQLIDQLKEYYNANVFTIFTFYSNNNDLNKPSNNPQALIQVQRDFFLCYKAINS